MCASIEMLLLVSKKEAAKLLLTRLHPPRDMRVGQRGSGAAWDAGGLDRDLLCSLCLVAFPTVTSLLAQQHPSHLTGCEVLLYATDICHRLCVSHSQPQQEQVSLEPGQAPKAVAQLPARLELWLQAVRGSIPPWLCGPHHSWVLHSSLLHDPLQRNEKLILNLNHC